MGQARRARPLTLDTGALVAWERDDRFARATIAEALASGVDVAIPAGVLAQAWRDGRRQARLAALIKSRRARIVTLDESGAKAAGELCGRTGTSDVIDASVVVCAQDRPEARVLTSDPGDLRRLDPALEVEAV